MESPSDAFNYTISNLANSTVSSFSTLLLSNLTATLPAVAPTYSAQLSGLTTNATILSQTPNRTSHYNLDTSNIVNSSHSFLSANGSAGNGSGLLLDCFDLFRNGSCLIGSKLSNDSQLLNEFAMPLVQQLIWSFIFGLIVFISTAGNLIICWIILFHRQMRSVTNFHLCMLSLFSSNKLFAFFISSFNSEEFEKAGV